MKRMYLAVVAGLLLMVPITVGVAYAADTSKSPPPIGQTLVRHTFGIIAHIIIDSVRPAIVSLIPGRYRNLAPFIK